MADAEHVRRAQHDQLEPVFQGIRLEDQLLRRLGIAVGRARPARRVFRHRAVRDAAPVIDPEGRQMHHPLDAGHMRRLGHVQHAADIDGVAVVDRVGDAAADQRCGVKQRVRRMIRDRRDQPGQVAHVVPHHLEIGVAEFGADEIVARRGVHEDHVLAPPDGVLRERGSNQPGAGDQRRHVVLPEIIGPIIP
ncbi:MAG: hypothetical protein IIA54_01595 [Chloroflexi bacterium]|nr:hypothetical protein [Chloroflexota bacterium]